MQLHPHLREVLKVIAEAGLRPIEEMTPAEAREQMEATARARNAGPLRIVRIKERLVPGPRRGDPSAALLAASIDGADASHRLFSWRRPRHRESRYARFRRPQPVRRTGVIVGSGDCRIGPDRKVPAAVDDSFAALEWDHANATSLGANPDQIGVRGDSAGSNLAPLAALLARDAAFEDLQRSPRRAQC